MRSTLPFAVVGIGASAGGIAALTEMLQELPTHAGMAVVVVMHLSPEHASSLPNLLQAATTMPVQAVDTPVPIEKDHVYVVPPGKQLTMNDGYLSVTELARAEGDPVTIDLFFRTLAIVHRARAFAVVLSGCGSDGSVGIARIKEEGGVTLAQSPRDAEFDAMPRAAIATGTVDWVMPAGELGSKLAELCGNAQRIQLPLADDGSFPEDPARPDTGQEAEQALRDVLLTLRARTGHDFRSYKRATVLRRLERRMQVNALSDLPAYRAYLQSEPSEAQALLQDLLIGVTNFFRDLESFEALQRDVLPPLLDDAAQQPGGLRGWVAGCATGEEAYSLAMMLSESASAIALPPKIHLFATDIDERAIGIARLGSYPSAIETDISPNRLRQFFDRSNDRYRIRKELREKVMFAAHNILRDPPFSKLHLISCRNLLIYLDRDVHAQILEMFHFALQPGGYLFLGSSESGDTASQLFTVVDKKNRIFRANVVGRAPRYVPSLQDSGFRRAAVPRLEPSPEKRLVTFAELHQRLVQQHAPPSVLIDGEGDIVHLSERASRYLTYAAGTPSHHLLTLVHPELRLELRAALLQAAQSGMSVEARRVHVSGDGRNRFVAMIVRPVPQPDLNGQLMMVLFDEVEDSIAREAMAPDAEGRDPAVVHLEGELRRLKEHLQNTTEHSETSTEELKASNEELQAINEELRSTTEELETSKEELQSINEELITVNQELKSKIEETGKIHDDLQNLIASTDIATVFVDRAMNIKRFTPHATKLFNLIPSDVGRSLLDITHKLDHDSLANDAAEAFRSLRMIEREVHGEDGRWYLARVLPYRTGEDRIEGAVLTFIDVTARRHAEESMRLVTASTMDFAIVTTDIHGLISTWNNGAERLFGHRAQDVLGQPIALIFTPEDRAAGAVEEEMQRALSDGRAEGDRWHLRKDGSRFFCSGITSPLYDRGQHCGYGRIARDRTGVRRAQVQNEVELRRETAGRAEAQASSQMKDEFLAVMSHELKNPLNLIQLNVELLTHLPESQAIPSVGKIARTIRGAVMSQAQIIEDLLDLSRVNTGKLVLHRAALDWVATVRQIADAVGKEALQKGVALTLELSDEPIVIEADAVRVEQIVWNLLSNAVKFTPAGGAVHVRLWAEGGRGHMQVRDNGRGIAPEALPHVFDLFSQGELGTAMRHGGLGIGLALVRHLVQAHGGAVLAQSDGLDRGATFNITLPLHERTAPAAAAPQPGHANLLNGVRALVVDDDREAVETLRELLVLGGADVTACGTGEEALEIATTRDFDFAVSDLAMPGMDGYQLLARLREQGRNWPVIALTGLGRASDAKRALSSGFAAHMKKPVLLDRLLETLQLVLKPDA